MTHIARQDEADPVPLTLAKVRDSRHRLLRRQLKRHFGDDVPDALRAFIADVDTAYHEFDEDRAMLERSLDLSSKELLQSNSELRAVLEAFPDVFMWLDTAGTIVAVQAADSGDLYVPARDLIGRGFFQMPCPTLAARLKNAFETVRRGEVVRIEYEIVMGANTRHYEARLLPIVNRQILAIVRNITDRKTAEIALAREKETLGVALESIDTAVLSTDAAGRVMLLNGLAEKYLGVRASDVIGHLADDHIDIIDEKTSRPVSIVAALLRDADASTPTARTVGQLRAADGSSRVVSVHGSLVLTHSATRVGTVVSIQDLTAQRAIDKELTRAAKLDSIGLLAGGIAHDFNNILAVIVGNLSVAETFAGLDPELQEIFDDVTQAAAQAQRLTRQLLTFAKGGAPVTATVSLEQLLLESVAFVLRGSNVVCTTNIASDLLPVEIDVGQINQVLNNLIINAVQAMPEGGKIHLSAFNVRLDGSEGFGVGRFARIDVEDHGTGISPEHLNHVFDPFWTTKATGSGLGLASCYSIVRNHQGHLTVTSELGRGSTFSIFLPTSDDTPSDFPVDDALLIAATSGRALVMDDDQRVRIALARMLRRRGFEVEQCDDGAAAIQKTVTAARIGAPFQLIVLDLTIPGGMGGKEASAKLRALSPDVKLVASSGYSSDPVMARHVEHGFDAVLPKPYTLRDLTTMLATLSFTTT